MIGFNCYTKVSTEEEWHHISFEYLSTLLYEYVNKQSPIIRQMLYGSIVSYGDIQFKIEKEG